MPSFLTQCPHCLTSFRVTDKQLEAAEGLVRCGACLGIFSAAANRITLKQTPEEAAAAAAAHGDDEVLEDELDETQDELQDDAGLDAPFYATPPQASGAQADFDDDEEDEYEDETHELHPADEPLLTEQVAEASIPDLLDREDFDIPLGDLNLELDAHTEEHALEHVYDDEEEEEEHDLDEPQHDGEEDDEYEEDEEDEEEFDDEEDDEDFDDDYEEVDPADEVYEEYVDEEPRAASATSEAPQAEEFIPEISFEDDDLPADAGEAFALADAHATRLEPVFAEQDLDALETDHDSDGLVDEIEEDEEEFGRSSEEDEAEFLDELDDEEHDEDEDDAAYERRPSPPVRAPGADKAALRRYLADIEDDEALGPLDDDALDTFDEPVMLDTAPRRSAWVSASLVLANVFLIGTLAWQLIAANIDSLSRSARFAPLLPYACRVVNCPAPERSQVSRIVSEQLLVRSHPRYAEALEVSLVFRNDAAEAQPFPALELGFHDTSNRLVANRLFKPSEYLPPELQTSEMPAKSSLQVVLELADPGSEAVNYTLAFRAP